MPPMVINIHQPIPTGRSKPDSSHNESALRREFPHRDEASQ
jgi:hypothetical protein